MKAKAVHILISVFIVLLLSSRAAAQDPLPQDPGPQDSSAPMTTPLTPAISYQGRLVDGGSPVNVPQDFLFILFDSSVNGSQVGGGVSVDNLPVTDGFFTVLLDFGGSSFNGEKRWLEVHARPGDSSSAFTKLSPRQELIAAPYALYSLKSAWGGLSGVPVGFADGVDNDTTTFWSLTGNSGTNPATQYIGTSDNTPLELRVNGYRALRLEWKTDGEASGPNLIAGYSNNSVTSGVFGATLFGGGVDVLTYPNRVTDIFGTVSGGADNRAGNYTGTIYDAEFATVGGGYGNIAAGSDSTVSGGYNNKAFGNYAAVGGGDSNQANGNYSTVCGGYNNQASSVSATIPGGTANVASGQTSFAAGYQANATHNGSFVWSSGTSTDSWGENTFTVRAHGGAIFYSSAGGLGAWLPAGANGWTVLSDRAAKENFQEIDPQVVLENLSKLPITSWNYLTQDDSIRHMGPVAQDFSAAYGLGEDERYISTVDADGVALAAAKGLYLLSQEQAARIETLEAENTQLNGRLTDIETRLAVLEGVGNSRATPTTSLGYLSYLGFAAMGLGIAWRKRSQGGAR